MKRRCFNRTATALFLMLIAGSGSIVCGGYLSAPPGMFKDLNDQTAGDAIIINGKQLFIDDYIVGERKGVEKVLNQPEKYPGNPLIVPDQPWEEGGASANGNVMYDEQEKIFKMWYVIWLPEKKGSEDGVGHIGGFGYAVSNDGIRWEKPAINDDRTSAVMVPKVKGIVAIGVFKDLDETDPQRRYKLFYTEKADGTDKSLATSVGYSPDGLRFTAEPANPVIPYSDTQTNCYRDPLTGRYVAYLRFGPPNKRIISRIASEDFVHWSPKITVLNYSKMDDDTVSATCGWTELYGMRIMPYDGVYIGLLTAYRGETIGEIKKEQEAWRDKVDVQLAFSRNGLAWRRVSKHGAIDMTRDHDWETLTKEATFMPYGKHKVDWDWGQIYAFQKPLIVGDEIWFYYTGLTGRHWATYHGDTRQSGIGLAKLRLDGFVSVNAEIEGTVTTRTLLFVGDSLEVNANAAGGSLQVEVLDSDGNTIEGFSRDACEPMTNDSVRHILKWNGSEDCHLIQARPIKLRFHMEKAKLYSFTPRIRHTHYIQSYD